MPKPEVRYVYAISDGKNKLKIGMANDPQKRLKDLQTGNDRNLTLTHAEPVNYKDAPKVETLARDIAKSMGKPKTREWLSKTTPEEGKYYIETAHQIVRGKNQR